MGICALSSSLRRQVERRRLELTAIGRGDEFVGRDVINKNTTDLAVRVQLGQLS